MGTFVSLHGWLFGIDSETGIPIYGGTPEALGAKNGATVTAQETGGAGVHKTVLSFTATPIAMTDDAGVAQYGGVKIYDFPAGSISILGARVVGNFTGYASLIDTFDGDVSLGTATATTGNTLTGTEANIMQSNAISTAVAEVAAVNAVSTAPVVISGVAAATDCYLNFLVDDNGAHGAGNAAFTGTVTIYWANLG